MRSGRPKASATKAPRRTAKSNDMKAAALNDPDLKPSKKKAPRSRTKTKRSLMAVINRDSRLSKYDKACISQAHADGFTVQDLAALTVYELRLAQLLFDDDKLAAKDLIIAINKAASHVAAATQIATAAPGGGANITVTFTAAGPASHRPEAAATGVPDPVVGDIIDAE